MSIASEITRLQGVKSDILQAIADKGVTVPAGSALDDCPLLIAAISGGGGFDMDSIVNIVPIQKIVIVDSNGYIGYDITNYFKASPDFYYNYAILAAGEDFSQSGLGQVTFYTPSSSVIGGRTYRTVIIGGREWLAENLDFKWTGLEITSDPKDTPAACYYNNDEATYGVNGNKYGLLYNWHAVDYLNTNRAQLIPGWHVPPATTASHQANEWGALFTAVGGTSVAGLKLKSTTGWPTGSEGDDSYGFGIVPAGGRTTSWNPDLAYYWGGVGWGYPVPTVQFTGEDSVGSSQGINKSYCFSLRLVRDTQ